MLEEFKLCVDYSYYKQHIHFYKLLMVAAALPWQKHFCSRINILDDTDEARTGVLHEPELLFSL